MASTLKESIVKEALETLSWEGLHAHLVDLDIDEVADQLFDIIRKSDTLIFRRHSPGKEKKREEFLQGLSGHIETTTVGDAHDRFLVLVAYLDTIEQGYRGILTLLPKTAGGAMPVERRLGAAFGRAAAAFDAVEREFQRALTMSRDYILQSTQIDLVDGRTSSVDDLLAGLVMCLGSTLSMEGHNNGWFKKGKLALPHVVETNAEDIARAYTVELLANSWGTWQRSELMARFLDAPIVMHTGPGRIEWCGADYNEIIEVGPPSDVALHDYIANERLSDSALQVDQQMRHQSSIEANVAGIADPLAVERGKFVSTEEALADYLLTRWFGFYISDSRQELSGLRLSEWVRGYAVLKALVEDVTKTGLFPNYPRQYLRELLTSLGLDSGKADIFLELATFKSSSRDLFDQPLIGMQDGTLTVCVPAVRHSAIARIVVSALSNLHVQVDGKGKAFETAMKVLFDEQKIPAFAFESTRDGEQYEYDLVVHWGRKLFVFECKNRTLSGYNNRAAYYFDLEMQSAVRQVKRLAEALKTYPDILLDRCGINVKDVEIVPCILNSLPYSRAGKVDGVYITDQSALHRFFEERHVHIIRPHEVSEGKTILHRTAVHRHWKYEAPTPADLLAAFEDPYPVKFVRFHTLVKTMEFPIGETRAARLLDYGRRATTLESVMEMNGMDVVAVRREMSKVTKSIRKAKSQNLLKGAESQRRAIAENERRWRNRRKPNSPK